jgi:hypothetical protein
MKILTFNIGDSANVVFSGKHKFIIDDPIGFVIEACRGMELYNLIIFNCQVVSSALQVGNLHEKSLNQCLANVDVVVFRCEIGAGALEIESVHDTSELLTDIIGRLE